MLLCLIQRYVSLLNQFVGQVWRTKFGQSNANTDPDMLELSIEVDRRLDRSEHPFTERIRILGVNQSLLDHGELVAAKASQRVPCTQALAQPIRHSS